MCVVEREVEKKLNFGDRKKQEKGKKVDDDRMISLLRKRVDVPFSEPAHLDHLCRHPHSSESLIRTLTCSILS